jgi:hypothetical protein
MIESIWRAVIERCMGHGKRVVINVRHVFALKHEQTGRVWWIILGGVIFVARSDIVCISFKETKSVWTVWIITEL